MWNIVVATAMDQVQQEPTQFPFLTTARNVHSDVKRVEKQLKKENKKVSEMESRVTLLRRMAKHIIPTRDVNSFVSKQANLTSIRKTPCKRVVKTAMRAKLKDAKLATTAKRKERDALKKELSYRLRENRQGYKNFIEELRIDAAEHKKHMNSKNSKNSMTRKKRKKEGVIPED